MAPSPEPQLTFGVEIECGARVHRSILSQMEEEYKIKTKRNYSTPRTALIYHLTGTLKNAGIPVHRVDRSTLQLNPDDFGRWLFDDDVSIVLSERFLDPNNNDEYEYFRLELVSRVLPLDDLAYVSDTHPPRRPKPREGIDEVVRVLKVLQQNSRVELFTNDSCGCHFHIAIKQPSKHRHPQRFSTETLRIFGGLVTAVERPINSVVGPKRIGNNHCVPPSRTMGMSGREMSSRLAEIQSKTDLEDLIEVMNPGHSRKHAYNFQNFGGFAERIVPLHTIEFRQHEGTLDPAAITAALQLYAGLVRLALHPSTEKRFPVWAEHAERETFTITDLLKKMNKPHLIGFYQAKECSAFDDSDDGDEGGPDGEGYPSSCYPVTEPGEEAREPRKRDVIKALASCGVAREEEGGKEKSKARPTSPVRRPRRPSGVGKVLGLLGSQKSKGHRKRMRSMRGEERVVIE